MSVKDVVRPEHLSEHHYGRLPQLWEPSQISFPQTKDLVDPRFRDIVINDLRVGWIEPRNHYCDRGHWKFGCELPDVDGADSFPRYYMDETRMLLEIISFFNWRLWRRNMS